MLEALSQFTHFDVKNGIILSFINKGNLLDEGKIMDVRGISAKIKAWGSDNLLPARRDSMLMESNIVGELISTKRDLLIGQGLMAYMEEFTDKGKERIPVPITPQIEDWIGKSNFEQDYLDGAVLNYFKHANIFAEFTMIKTGEMSSITSRDAKYMRAAEQVAGLIPGYFRCSDWKETISPAKNPAVYTPAYDPGRKLPKFIYHIGNNVFHDGYYFHPAYWGGEEWIDVANMIPVFHKYNMQNGYSPRFHIKVPADYFVDMKSYKLAASDPDKLKECLDEAGKKKQKFIDDLNLFLAGNDNSGRAVFTTTTFDEFRKVWSGIEIEPITFDMKDSALLDLFEKSNQANISAQGFPSALAGIDTQGKLSSGSEIRNILMYYIISKLPRPRRDVLRPFELMLKMNGWYDPKVKYTFEDILITKLDQNKSGVQPVMDGAAEAEK